MSKTLNRRRQPRFDLINKHNVTIKSLRNQLHRAEGIDELTTIASKIIELEQQIMIEKSIGYRQLEESKKQLLYKINKLQRSLQKAEADLSQIDTKLDFKLNGYRNRLQEKIDLLNSEYQSIAGFIS